MRSLLRLCLAIVMGSTGLLALLLVLQPDVYPNQRAWAIASVTVLMAAGLVGTSWDLIAERGGEAEARAAPATSAAEREVHGEIIKVIGLLNSQTEASTNFSAALDKAKQQLPDGLSPEKVRLVISYLMIENDNMRSRSAEFQGNLEKSQRQIEKLKSYLAAAEAQGLSDPLTGLKNRRSFDLTLAAEVAAARNAGKPLCLVMADIDHFKAINDRYGHQSGDEVLKWFSRILSGNMKGRDTVARYGGEEFAIILPQTTLDYAATLAGQIRMQVEGQFWKKPGAPNTMLKVTASFGVAQLAAGEGTSGLIGRAGAKLYESKSGGRNRVAA